MDNKRVFLMMGVFALFLVSMIVSQYYNALNNAERLKKRKAEYGDLHFSGKVISYKVYKYLNKNSYQVCVKIDSPKVKDLFIYNDDDGIKIKNIVATFSAGFLIHLLGPADSVAVNMDADGKIVYHYKANVLNKTPMVFDPMGLQKNDLNNCD